MREKELGVGHTIPDTPKVRDEFIDRMTDSSSIQHNMKTHTQYGMSVYVLKTLGTNKIS